MKKLWKDKNFRDTIDELDYLTSKQKEFIKKEHSEWSEYWRKSGESDMNEQNYRYVQRQVWEEIIEDLMDMVEKVRELKNI